MSPCVEGAPSTQDRKIASSPAPRGLHGHLVEQPFRHSKTPWQQKKGTSGQEPMQFTCSSFGQQKEQGAEGAIKILQINYTKKKANYLYKKSVQGLHFAVIICTNSAGRKQTRVFASVLNQGVTPAQMCVCARKTMWTNLHSWPVHLHQYLLLWSSHPPPRQSASHPGLSSHDAAQQHWCIRCHPNVGD